MFVLSALFKMVSLSAKAFLTSLKTRQMKIEDREGDRGTGREGEGRRERERERERERVRVRWGLR